MWNQKHVVTNFRLIQLDYIIDHFNFMVFALKVWVGKVSIWFILLLYYITTNYFIDMITSNSTPFTPRSSEQNGNQMYCSRTQSNGAWTSNLCIMLSCCQSVIQHYFLHPNDYEFPRWIKVIYASPNLSKYQFIWSKVKVTNVNIISDEIHKVVACFPRIDQSHYMCVINHCTTLSSMSHLVFQQDAGAMKLWIFYFKKDKPVMKSGGRGPWPLGGCIKVCDQIDSTPPHCTPFKNDSKESITRVNFELKLVSFRCYEQNVTKQQHNINTIWNFYVHHKTG